MWILLGIVLVLLILITIILLLPIDVILKTDENGELIFRYKLLGKTYGEHPDPNNPIAKLLKKIVGLPRLETEQIKQRAKDANFTTAVSETVAMITKLIKRVLELLRFGTVKVLHINIVCATGDAAQTAICYGTCYAALSPLVALLHSSLKIKKSGERICITPDYTADNGSFNFEIFARFRMFRALGALNRAASDEAARKEREKTTAETKK